MYHESLELDFLPTSMRYIFFLPPLYGDIESNKMKQHEFAWFLGLFMYMYIYSSFLHPKITAKQQQVKLASKRLQPTRMGNNN
jgi:hypothetical protein